MATDAVAICNEALARIGAEAITSLTANAKITDRMCNTFYSVERDRLLKKYSWNFAKKATPLNRTDLYDTSDDYSDEVTITGATAANPVVITAANNYSDGMHTYIYDVSGMTELNELVFEVADANSASFQLLGVDGTKYTAYSSGGKAYRIEPMLAYRDGYTYDLPTDCLKPLYLDSGTEFEILESRLVTLDDEAILVYTKAATDTTLFPDEFEECLVSRLAAVLCMPILGAKTGAQLLPTMEAVYRQSLREAEKSNCISIKKDYTYSDGWITSRV